jgi:thioredoxin 1
MNRIQSAELVRLTDANFNRLVLKNAQPVVVDFWAHWCQPCKAVQPKLVGMMQDLEGKALFGAVDIMEDGSVAERYCITSVPTILVFHQGRVVETYIGLQPNFERNLRAKLKELGA